MATKTVKTLSATTSEILNAIRNGASTNYREFVPTSTENSDVKEIGGVIMQYEFLQNEFISVLVNRIGRVIVSSKLYKNPLEMFKKGLLEYGETIEDVFVSLIKAEDFNPQSAESTVFKRRLPNVKTAFYSMNFQKVYPVTVSRQQLSQAFLSESGITDLIAKITESIYASVSYDELLVTKYCLAKNILEGRLYAKEINGESAEDTTVSIKSVSNAIRFMSDKYNIAGVTTYTDISDQYIIMSSDFDAENSVKVLASAFNIDEASFLGKRVLLDSFSFSDSEIARLTELLKETPHYTEISADENKALEEIKCVLIDRDFLQIYDNLYDFTEQYNANGLYWNYFNHVWKTFAVSPFANAIVFVTGEPAVTSVSITPSESTSSVGQSVQLSVSVDTTNFAPQSVTWSCNSDYATVDYNGLVKILDGASGSVEVTATSTYDTTKSAKATITIS